MNNTIDTKDLLTIDRQTGKKIVYIVYNKKDVKIAEVARSLIGMTKNIKCSILEDNVLYSNYQISSDNILIFIGDVKNALESRKLAENARNSKKYGIHYGWNGKQAFIWKESIHFSKEDKKAFLAEYEKEFGKINSKYSLKDFLGDAGMAVLFGLIGLGAKKGIESYINSKKTKSYILPLAVVKFVNNELEKFIAQATGEVA